MKVMFVLVALIFSLTASAANCELGPIKNLLRENVISSLSCLDNNIQELLKVIQPNEAGEVTLATIKLYMDQTNTPEGSAEIMGILTAVSDLNYLIAGDSKGILKAETTAQTIELLKHFNIQFSGTITPLLESEEAATFNLHRIHKSRIRDASNRVAIALRRNFRIEGAVRTVDIQALVRNLLGDEVEPKKLLFIKKILSGGNKAELTSKELENLIYALPSNIETALDVNRFKYLILDQRSTIELAKTLIENLNALTVGRGNRDGEVIFTMSEVEEVFPDIKKFRNLILEAKSIFGDSDSKNMTGAELKHILAAGEKAMQGGNILYRLYDKYKAQMESGLPVTISLEDASQTYPEYPDYIKSFIRIVAQYRFIKGNAEAPYFTENYRRNADAIAETFLTEYVLNAALKKYGALDAAKIQNLTKKFERELVQLEIILPRMSGQFADSITLFSAGFNSQANGDSVLDVNELTELVTFRRSEIAKKVSKILENSCSADEFGRLETACVKKNILSTLCEGNKAQFNLLCKEMSSDVNSASYVEKLTKASRTCQVYSDKEEIPFSQMDFAGFSSALMHVESVLIKWDANQNNILDASEVDLAYSQLSIMLDVYLAKEPSLKKFKKQIFAYVLRYGKYPDVNSFGGVARLVKFLAGFHARTIATRTMLASLVAATRMELEKARAENGEAFNCDYLKDPEHIPQE